MPPNISVDPAFKNVAGNMTGFHIWRIENMQVVPLPSEAWGKFFNGDAYIVLSSAPHGTRYYSINKQNRFFQNGFVKWWYECQTWTSQW